VQGVPLSVVGFVAVSAFPLVIFAPDTFQQRLFDFLHQHFDVCWGNLNISQFF